MGEPSLVLPDDLLNTRSRLALRNMPLGSSCSLSRQNSPHLGYSSSKSCPPYLWSWPTRHTTTCQCWLVSIVMTNTTHNHLSVLVGFFSQSIPVLHTHHLIGLVVKASALGAEDPVFESRLRQDFSGSSHTSDLKICHSSSYPARCLALQGQRWDWSARCQYTVAGWGRKCDLQLLSQCGST